MANVATVEIDGAQFFGATLARPLSQGLFAELSEHAQVRVLGRDTLYLRCHATSCASGNIFGESCASCPAQVLINAGARVYNAPPCQRQQSMSSRSEVF